MKSQVQNNNRNTPEKGETGEPLAQQEARQTFNRTLVDGPNEDSPPKR